MQLSLVLVTLAVVASADSRDVASTQPGNLSLIQENFVLDQFMGRWYEVAVTSTCPHYMKRKRADPVVVELMFEHSQGNLTMSSSALREGSCSQTLIVYNLTSTPGRLFHHVPRFAADVDSFVVQTNYTDYAVMFLQGIEQPLEITTFTAKLYSRSVDYGSPLLDRFKSLLKRLGLKDDEVIINEYKGTCDPRHHVTAGPPTAPQVIDSSKSPTARDKQTLL